MTDNSAPGFGAHPTHSIEITLYPALVRAELHGQTIASSRQAVVMAEANYAPVCYFPRAHVRMDALRPVAHSTYCPFKGHASYFDIRVDAHTVARGAWSYETPYDEMLAIKMCIAFSWCAMTAWFREDSHLPAPTSLLL